MNDFILGNNTRNVSRYYKEIDSINTNGLEWNELNNKKVLVLGATGKLGKSLVDFLALRNCSYNSNIFICVNSRNMEHVTRDFEAYLHYAWFTVWIEDINNDVLNIPEDIDYAIIGGGNTHPLLYSLEPVDTLRTNINMVEKMCKYAMNRKCKIIFLSSIAVYGDQPKEIDRFCENDYGYFDSCIIKNSYAEAKRAAEAIGFAYNKQYSVPFISVRLAKVFGPINDYNDSNVRNQLIWDAFYKKKILLISEAKQISTYLYFVDAITGIFHMLFHGKDGNVYNLANENNEISLKEFAKIIVKCRPGVTLEQTIKHDAIYSSIQRTTLSSNKARALGWNPLIDVKDGLMRTFKIMDDMEKKNE